MGRVRGGIIGQIQRYFIRRKNYKIMKAHYIKKGYMKDLNEKNISFKDLSDYTDECFKRMAEDMFGDPTKPRPKSFRKKIKERIKRFLKSREKAILDEL